MKHSLKIIAILLLMFILAQLIGIAVVKSYTLRNDALPYGMEPPKDIRPSTSLISIIVAIAIAIIIMLVLMWFKIEFFLRLWFFFVITLAIGITINAAIFSFPYSSLIAFFIAFPLALLKVFRRNILIHNLTELMIYPGIAAIFVPLMNLWTISILLIIISLYDMYAVWHSGFMQRMAKYQIQKLKMFSGFFIPYIGRKDREKLLKLKKGNVKTKKIKLNIAILGGGDVVFPIIFAGVILRTFGMVSSLIVVAGASLALALLFAFSQKGRFYPAMPFISAGCFAALWLNLFLL